MTVTAKAGAGAASHHVSDGTSIVWHQTACAVCGLQGQTVRAGRGNGGSPPRLSAAYPFAGAAFEGLEPCAGTTGKHGSERAEGR